MDGPLVSTSPQPSRMLLPALARRALRAPLAAPASTARTPNPTGVKLDRCFEGPAAPCPASSAEGRCKAAGLGLTIGAMATARVELFSWIERRTNGRVHRGSRAAGTSSGHRSNEAPAMTPLRHSSAAEQTEALPARKAQRHGVPGGRA